MSTAESTDIVRRYFTAYENGNHAAIERLLADDFRFTSPYDATIDRACYMRRCWPNSEHIRRYHFRKLVADGDDVLVVYELELDDGSRLRNAEMFRVVGGRIHEVEVYFGALGQQEAFDYAANAAPGARREECS